MHKTPIALTTHAVARYRERMAPALSLDEAQDELHLRLVRAELISFDGVTFEYWFRGEPTGRAIVRRDRGTLVCVTIKYPSVRQAEEEAPTATLVDPCPATLPCGSTST